MVRVLPLSHEDLRNAISVIKRIFPYKSDQKLSEYSLTNSLGKADYGQTYWVAVNEEKRVIGITGIYNDKYDSSIVWLGWFGVHPAHRRLGIGSMLLQYAIDEASRKDAAKLRLYTSSDPNERAAHELYRKFGFKQTRIDRNADKIYFMKSLKEDSMAKHEIKINWSGPYGLNKVIETMNDEGIEENGWSGNDYGLYQIYGRHILYGGNALLYVGIATQQTFSQRFSQHEIWLADDQEEQDIAIYLGRVNDPLRHSKKDRWKSWEEDVKLAEKILTYKYSPNYNSKELQSEPDLSLHENMRLTHDGERNRLSAYDEVPRDFHEW